MAQTRKPGRGRSRKAKRNFRNGTDRQLIARDGGHWIPASTKEERENNALVHQYATRWNTDGNQLEFDELAELEQLRCEEADDKLLQSKTYDIARKLRAKELAVLITQRNMLSPNPAISNMAVGNLVRMEAQNQADEHVKKGIDTSATVPTIQLIAISNRSQVVELEKFVNAIEPSGNHGTIIDE